MKRKIITLIAIVGYSATLFTTGAMLKGNQAQASSNNRFTIWQDAQGSYIYSDNQTKCLYLVIYSKGGGVAITPMLDEQGKPARYR